MLTLKNLTSIAILATGIFGFNTMKPDTSLVYEFYNYTKHSAEDIVCLAKNIYFEARGENLSGKVAVAQVTLNRVNHKTQFEKTVCKVVYAKKQFSWTEHKHLKVVDKKAWQEAYIIAETILKGNLLVKPINALYFHTTEVKPKWSFTKVVETKIGKHIFYS